MNWQLVSYYDQGNAADLFLLRECVETSLIETAHESWLYKSEVTVEHLPYLHLFLEEFSYYLAAQQVIYCFHSLCTPNGSFVVEQNKFKWLQCEDAGIIFPSPIMGPEHVGRSSIYSPALIVCEE